MAKNDRTHTGRTTVEAPSKQMPERTDYGDIGDRRSARQPSRAPGQLVGFCDDRPFLNLRLNENRIYTLGRRAPSELIFDDPAVSKLHGTLRFREGRGWFFTDTGSTNGTLRFPRGTSIERPELADVIFGGMFEVAEGDVLCLGSLRCRIEFHEATTSGVTGPRKTPSILVSRAARELDEALSTAAKTKAPLFLFGPSGSGKTHAAQEVHVKSRRKGQFVPINCASLPDDAQALTARLLGFVKGGFTGAVRDDDGLLHAAHGGTLFLDEVESLCERAQGFLLDVLEGRGDYLQLGGHRRRGPPDLKLISASKMRLRHTKLREDLCFRLMGGGFVEIPLLEDRKEDIEGFLHIFANKACEEEFFDGRVTFAPAAIEFAKNHAWRGEIRELASTTKEVVRAAIREPTDRQTIVVDERAFRRRTEHYARAFGYQNDGASAWDEKTGEYSFDATGRNRDRVVVSTRQLGPQDIADALSESEGNKMRAARALGIALNTLKNKMRKFDLENPKAKRPKT